MEEHASNSMFNSGNVAANFVKLVSLIHISDPNMLWASLACIRKRVTAVTTIQLTMFWRNFESSRSMWLGGARPIL